MSVFYDGNGNEIVVGGGGDGGNLDQAFFCEKVCLAANVKSLFYGDGVYYQNPMTFSTSQINVLFYNANNEIMFLHDENGDPASIQHSTLGYVYLQNRCSLTISGTKLTYKLYVSASAFRADQPSNVYDFWFNEVPSYIKPGGKMSYNVMSSDSISDDLYYTKYKSDASVGFLEQMNDETSGADIDALSTRNEQARRFRTEVIREANRTHHAIRVGTFNVARYGQYHWYKIKECLQNYGVDICGLQEVSYPLGDGGTDATSQKLSDAFSSWQFDSFSTNGASGDFPSNDHYANNVRSMMAGNGFKIDSSVETQFSTQGGSNWDYRYVEKCVLSLPRYKDKRGSENLKMSVYNTQLELSASQNQAQVAEILSMIQNDPNPFIIVLGDTNDFTLNKASWELFRNAGLTPVVNTNTSTVAGTEDFNCIDNLFVNSRIHALDWNVVWAQEWPWSKNGVVQPMLSDHDFVYADLALDYSDIRCVNLFLSHCTTTWSRGWLSNSETVTITIVPDDGYSLPVSPNKMLDCMIANPQALSYSNGTITIDGSKLIGDVYIKVVATAS